MMPLPEDQPTSYNERLYGTNRFRKKLHLARYRWLSNQTSRPDLNYETVLELGCHDGKSIDYHARNPTYYLGLDADWENGLRAARNKWESSNNYEFKKCTTSTEMESVLDGTTYDISICMETLEHIPPHDVDGYLHELARATRRYVFITVPNETGVIFLVRCLARAYLRDSGIGYSVGEFMYQVSGFTNKVPRRDHKGFNYRKLVEEIGNHFHIVRIEGIPIKFIHHSLNFTIGIVGVKK